MRYGGTDLIAEDGVSDTDVWGSDFSSFTSQEGGTVSYTHLTLPTKRIV